MGICIPKCIALTSDLLYTALLGTIFFFRLVSVLKLVYFSDILGFKYAYFCLEIRPNLYRFFKDIHPSGKKL